MSLVSSRSINRHERTTHLLNIKQTINSKINYYTKLVRDTFTKLKPSIQDIRLYIKNMFTILSTFALE